MPSYQEEIGTLIGTEVEYVETKGEDDHVQAKKRGLRRTLLMPWSQTSSLHLNGTLFT